MKRGRLSSARSSGGGWAAIWYALRKARASGGLWAMWKALRSRNACKTCALGMGGQLGGMVNELGRWPEVCKKSIQAMAADMQGHVHEHFFDDFSLEKLRGFSSRELEAAGRLVEPVIAGPLDSHYRRISWDDALARIAEKLKKTTPDESFFYFSGRSSNEAAFLLQLFARLYGTNNVNNCSYYCHQASGVALTSAIGSSTATVQLEDIEDTKLLFIIGGNPASNHPRFMRTLVNLRRHGGKVVVINPLRELGLVRFRVPSDPRSLLFGSTIADEYLQPHIGGDIALLAGIAKAVIEADAVDERFVHEHCDDWAAFKSSIEAMRWEEIVASSGVDHAAIKRVADLYARAPSAIFCWTMGITHHEHGVANVQMIANLAMLRGMLGRPASGLLPLRGHSNVQGIGSMGVTPKLRDAIFQNLEKHMDVKLPTSAGLDTLGAIHRAAEGRIRFACCLGGNLFGSTPDSSFASAALSRVDSVVYLSTTLNTGHAHGRGRETIILPVLARDEEHQPTTQESMFNFVRLSDGGIHRLEGPRSEVEIIAAIAESVLRNTPCPPLQWRALSCHAKIRELISRVIPGYEPVAEMDRTKQEFQIAGRTLREPRFATDTGRAKFHAVALPKFHSLNAARSELGTQDSELRLMTLRSEGQFNTVVYEEEDIYRGQERRDVIMMSEADIERFGLEIDQRVIVRSEAGALSNVLVRAIDIRAGNAAMYYPEANALVPRRFDERSRTPAFKSVAITIEPDFAMNGVNGARVIPATPTAAAPPRNLPAC